MLSAAAAQRMGEMMRGWGWGFAVFGVLFWLVVLVLLVLLVWRLVQGPPAAAPPPTAESPLDILKRRYARGEIDREEFEAKKRDLGYG